MGLYHKKDNGNYMGDPGKKEGRREGSGTPVSKAFQNGQISRQPGREDNYPKAGKDLAPSFQNMRTQDSKKGRI